MSKTTRTNQIKKAYSALTALEKIEIARAYPDAVKSHAMVRVNGQKVRLIDLTEKQRLALPVHLSVMTGKLKGIKALSTTCVINSECLRAMNDPSSPCYQCFAAKTAAQYNSLREHLENNYLILNSRELSTNECKAICKGLKGRNRTKVRLEPFGDVGTVQQALNYVKIMNVGKEYGLTFGVWTKLPHVWAQAFNIASKPTNMIFQYSAPSLNQTDIPIIRAYDFFDNAFIVCDTDKYNDVKAQLQADNRQIHECQCAAGSCHNDDICGYCYRLEGRKERHNNECGYIIEKLRK